MKRHDGRVRAADDARGARLGSLGLTAFALVVALTATAVGGASLALAALAWCAVSVALWAVCYGRR